MQDESLEQESKEEEELFRKFREFLKLERHGHELPQQEERELFEKFQVFLKQDEKIRCSNLKIEQVETGGIELVTKEEHEEYIRKTGFEKTIVPYFDGKEVNPIVTDIRNEYALVGLMNFIMMCERNHFHLVYPPKESRSQKRRNRKKSNTTLVKKGLHLFYLYPTFKHSSEGDTLHMFLESDYEHLLEKIKYGDKLLRIYDHKTMVMVGFFFPLEGGGAKGEDSVLNIHLYDIKTRQRLTTDNRVRIDYF